MLQQICIAGGIIAVDALLILMDELYASLLRQIKHDLQAAQHLRTGRLIGFPSRIETEHADALAVQHAAQFQAVLEQRQMLLKGNAQLGLDQLRFLNGQGGNIFAVHTAQLDEGDALLLQRLDLLIQSGTSFVRKGGQDKLGHV